MNRSFAMNAMNFSIEISCNRTLDKSDLAKIKTICELAVELLSDVQSPVDPAKESNDEKA